MDRRNFLAGIGGAALALGCSSQAGATANDAVRDDLPGPTLRQRALARGLISGFAVRRADFDADPRYGAVVAAEAVAITPEYELKWASVHPEPRRYDFREGDALAALAARSDLALRGHALVWHQANPDWLRPALMRGGAVQILGDHIATVAGHFGRNIRSWDVVNEAIEPADGLPGGLRRSPWLEAIGPSYIDQAFRMAAAAAPGAMLVLNEYGLDSDTPDEAARREAILTLLTGLVRRGVPVHALGLQGHLRAAGKPFRPAVLADFLARIAGLGLRILVTELDVSDDRLPADEDMRDAAIAVLTYDYLTVCFNQPACLGVMCWGVGDRHSWLNDANDYARADRRPQRALPFDDRLRRKPMWAAIAQAIDEAPSRVPAVPPG